MAFKGITFAGQNVTPKNDGGLYGAHYGDGILWGCSMALSGDDLVIQSGEFIMGGRYVQVDGATPVDLSGRTLQTGYIQVIMNADLTQGEGNQWYPTFVESATTTFPALTQGNINDTDTLYQLELAVVQISGGNLTNIIQTAVASTVVVDTHNYDVMGRIVPYDSGEGVSYEVTESGVPSGGFFVHRNGHIHLYGNGTQPIHFRPNGRADGTNEVAIDTAGQIIGGCTLYTGTGTTPHNYSGSEVNTPTTILDLQNLPSGYYIIHGFLSQTFSSSVSGQTFASIYNNGTNVVQDLTQFTSRPSFYKTVNTIGKFSGRITLALDSNQACQVRGHLLALRIG